MKAVEEAENKYDLSSLRVCQSAGESLPGSIRDEWGKRFRVDLIDSLIRTLTKCLVGKLERCL